MQSPQEWRYDGATTKGPRFQLQRIYDDAPTDGAYRVLVDRLWARGVTKEAAALDEWAKDVAPSTELRRWYGHDVDRFEEFATRYLDELGEPPALAAVEHLCAVADRQQVVLLTATRDVEHSGAEVLLQHLQGQRR